jgi:hypothetical protein
VPTMLKSTFSQNKGFTRLLNLMRMKTQAKKAPASLLNPMKCLNQAKLKNTKPKVSIKMKTLHKTSSQMNPQSQGQDLGKPSTNQDVLLYYQRLEEMGCVSLGLVGAGLGGSFQDTHELHVMKYDQAMNSKDKKSWVKAVDKEHGQMEKYKVFKAVKKSALPKKAKVLSSTWAMKKKSNGTYCA